MGQGLDVAATMFQHPTGERWILLFSDGKPESFSSWENPEAIALSAATRARKAGIRIVAIGTGLADANLLTQVTGKSKNVIISDPSALAEAFRRSEEVINNRQMLASRTNTVSFWDSVLRTGIWAGLIAIGVALGLVVGENRHLRRRTLSLKDATIVLAGGVITGLAAGAAGQSIFYVLSDVPAIVAKGRAVAWTLLGMGVGYGMGFFVPNLRRRRAAIAGAVGGVIAAFCFQTLVPVVGDTIGRLLGAVILGLSAGMTTVLVEAVFRQAWLVVHWSEKEKSTLALGPTPVLVGSSLKAHVLLAEQDSPVPVMARISLTDGIVRLKDGQTKKTRPLGDGEILTYGRTRIQVRASTGDAARSASQPEESAGEAPEKQVVSAVSEPGGSAPASGAKWYNPDSSS
jgi:Ca-activated chloride channel family protein